jgi:hypothetical protein
MSACFISLRPSSRPRAGENLTRRPNCVATDFALGATEVDASLPKKRAGLRTACVWTICTKFTAAFGGLAFLPHNSEEPGGVARPRGRPRASIASQPLSRTGDRQSARIGPGARVHRERLSRVRTTRATSGVPVENGHARSFGPAFAGRLLGACSSHWVSAWHSLVGLVDEPKKATICPIFRWRSYEYAFETWRCWMVNGPEERSGKIR